MVEQTVDTGDYDKAYLKACLHRVGNDGFVLDFTFRLRLCLESVYYPSRYIPKKRCMA